jgi:hypothetical protein
MQRPVILAVVTAIALMGTVVPAHAILVAYSTSVTFNGLPTATFGGITISFNGVSNLADAPTFAGLGMFHVDGGAGAPSSPIQVVLSINQSIPSAGSASSLVGALTGEFTSPIGGGGQIDWSSTHATIGLVDYDIATGSVILVPSASNTGGGPGNTMVHGQISVVPEPSTLLLVGTGLTLLAGMARRYWARGPQI